MNASGIPDKLRYLMPCGGLITHSLHVITLADIVAAIYRRDYESDYADSVPPLGMRRVPRRSRHAAP